MVLFSPKEAIPYFVLQSTDGGANISLPVHSFIIDDPILEEAEDEDPIVEEG